LEPKIYEGKKLPKWDPKAKRGQFLGMSKQHASTISLINNLWTEAISQQYHVVYNEHFTTVPSMVDLDELEVPPNWLELLMYSWDFVLQDETLHSFPIWTTNGLTWKRFGSKMNGSMDIWYTSTGCWCSLQREYQRYRMATDDSNDDYVPALIKNKDPNDDNNEAVGALPNNDGTNINEVPPPAPENILLSHHMPAMPIQGILKIIL